MSDRVRAIPLIQFMFDEYSLKIKDKPTYILDKYKESGYEQPKRYPLPDGTLPMTGSEKTELAKMLCLKTIHRLVYIGEEIIVYVSPYHNAFEISNIKTILYLAERFNLNEV